MESTRDEQEIKAEGRRQEKEPLYIVTIMT
jgi:hypothetical protein